MKRYIVVLVALLSLTSCKIADGFSRNEDAVDRLLYNRSLTAIREASNLSYYAIYADILLGGDETEIRLINAVLSKNYLVTIEEDGVKFQRILSNGVLENSYKVITGGKRLSEGAVWELTTISQYQKLSAQFVVVTLLSFFHSLKMLFKVSSLCVSSAVNTLKHFLCGVASPVSTCTSSKLECLYS